MKKIILFILIVLLISCSSKKDKLATEVQTIANRINKAFVDTRKNAFIRKKIIENAYQNIENYQLSISEMDESDGGVYKWHEDYLYYHTKDIFNGKGLVLLLSSRRGLYLDENIAYHPSNFHKTKKINSNSPELKKIKKEIRLWEIILKDVASAGETIEYQEYTFFMNPRQMLVVFSMYFDFLSIISPNFTQKIFNDLEWVRNGTPYANPEGKVIWTKDAFVALGGEGLLQTLSLPLYVKRKYLGFLNISLFPIQIADQEIKKNSNILLFLGSNLSILGSSQTAKEYLKIRDISEYFYLTQLTKNPMIKEKYKLTDKSQEDYTQKIGQSILDGKKDFEISVENKSYDIIVKEISEVNFYIVGLVEK